MEVLVALVEAYYNRHYPVGLADPVEAIKFRMEQQYICGNLRQEYRNEYLYPNRRCAVRNRQGTRKGRNAIRPATSAYWAKVGRAALDNPELPIELVRDTLQAMEEESEPFDLPSA